MIFLNFRASFFFLIFWAIPRKEAGGKCSFFFDFFDFLIFLNFGHPGNSKKSKKNGKIFFFEFFVFFEFGPFPERKLVRSVHFFLIF